MDVPCVKGTRLLQQKEITGNGPQEKRPNKRETSFSSTQQRGKAKARKSRQKNAKRRMATQSGLLKRQGLPENKLTLGGGKDRENAAAGKTEKGVNKVDLGKK